jgi:aminopeptidase N
VVDRYTFAPFTTLDFATFLRDYSGVDMRTQFLDWLYNGREPSVTAGGSLPGRAEWKALDLDPPWAPRRAGPGGGR